MIETIFNVFHVMSKFHINSLTLILLWLTVINLAAFITMGRDKKKARSGAFRTPEATMFLQAALGGSIGCILGMLVFHHKTRKWKFRIGMPVILILQVTLVILLVRSATEIVFM